MYTISKKSKAILFSVAITFLIAVLESMLGINGYTEWYPALSKPVDSPVWLFLAIRILFYTTCIIVLSRLFYKYMEGSSRSSVALLLFMMVFAGNIGSVRRIEYTVLGDCVNIAGRIEAMTKRVGVDILMTEKPGKKPQCVKKLSL